MTQLLSRILSQQASRPALEIGDTQWTYGELTGKSAAIATELANWTHGEHKLVAILAMRSLSAYAGVLAAHMGGYGYCPLHSKFPPERTRRMFEESGARALIVDIEGLPMLQELLATATGNYLIIGPEIDSFADLPSSYPGCKFIAAGSLVSCFVESSTVEDPDSTAYLLFTSGSTGQPKGVPVSHRNLSSYVDYITTTFPLSPDDRCSQTFDLTFDLSVHDMFVTWASGACLCPLTLSPVLAAKFIRDAELTTWFSVPSVAMMMARARTLRPGIFPSLRISFFCGEPLPVNTAGAWAEAAPRSRVINLYGPTEATIAIAAYEWDADVSPEQSRHGIVPLGAIFPTQRGVLVTAELNEVAGAGSGELCLSGSQVTSGYLNRPEKTAEQFVILEGHGDCTWYRTGDRVARDENGCLFFEGRTDHQVKIRGNRIELQEVEAVLREASGVDSVVAVPWPLSPAVPESIIGCVSAGGRRLDVQRVKDRCGERLPSYMVPSKIVELESLPLNANGKIDRRAVAASIPADI